MVLGIPIFKHIRVNNFNAQLNTAIQLLAFVKENMFFHWPAGHILPYFFGYKTEFIPSKTIRKI